MPTPDKDATSDRYTGSLTMQVDPVVIAFLTNIQQAQHTGDVSRETEQKALLAVHVDEYQPKPLYRPLPLWAKP